MTGRSAPDRLRSAVEQLLTDLADHDVGIRLEDGHGSSIRRPGPPPEPKKPSGRAA